jgi:diguanylate cyclase (GGDEF)-like protein
MIGCRIKLGKGVSGWVAAYKRPILNTGPALEFQGIYGDFASLKDGMAVPLLCEGECLGTITLYSQEPDVFTDDHVFLLQIAAEHVASLVAVARSQGRTAHDGILDAVTGAHRTGYLSVAGAPILAHAAKNESPLSLFCLEIRNLAQHVSYHGAAAGDSLLRKVAEILRSELRQTDILVRFGPFGFAALLPGVSASQAARYVSRLQQQIRTTPFVLSQGATSHVACQTGIASYPDDGTTLVALLDAARRNISDHTQIAGSPSAGAEGNVVEFPPRT